MLRDFVEWQIGEGSHGLVRPADRRIGHLPVEEHWRVIQACADQARGAFRHRRLRLQLHPIGHRQRSGGAGAWRRRAYSSFLIIIGEQEGVYAHFAAHRRATSLPIVVYNVPGRTVTDVEPETLARVAALPNVVGIKDASGDLSRVSAHRRLIGTDFVQLSGNDDLALGFLAMGGVGTISVTANVAPRLFARFHDAYLDGDLATALEINDRLFPLHKALFTDASPGPVKYALSRVRAGFPPGLRLPLTRPRKRAAGGRCGARTCEH